MTTVLNFIDTQYQLYFFCNYDPTPPAHKLVSPSCIQYVILMTSLQLMRCMNLTGVSITTIYCLFHVGTAEWQMMSKSFNTSKSICLSLYPWPCRWYSCGCGVGEDSRVLDNLPGNVADSIYRHHSYQSFQRGCITFLEGVLQFWCWNHLGNRRNTSN